MTTTSNPPMDDNPPLDIQGDAAVGTYRSLWRNRSARGYLCGQAVSMFGDNALWIGVAVLAQELTGAAAAAGLVVFVVALPQILAPFAGAAVDRYDRRRFLLITNSVGALIVLPLIMVRSIGQLPVLYAVMFLYGVVAASLNTGQSAYLTDVLPREMLPFANSVLRGVREGLRLAAPIGGVLVLVYVGQTALVAIDVASFIVAACTMWFLPRAPAHHTGDPAGAKEPMLSRALAGMSFARRHAGLRAVLATGALAFAAYGLSESVIFSLAGLLGRPPSFVGFLSATTGVGGLAGGVTAAWIAGRRTSQFLAGTGLGVLATACPLLASGMLPAVLAGEALFGLSLPWAAIGLTTIIQLESPAHLQGRIYGAFEVAVGAPQVLAIAGGAGMVAALGPRFSLLTMAILAVSGAVMIGRAPRSFPGSKQEGGRPRYPPVQGSRSLRNIKAQKASARGFPSGSSTRSKS